jgi:hypothetical protein
MKNKYVVRNIFIKMIVMEHSVHVRDLKGLFQDQ